MTAFREEVSRGSSLLGVVLVLGVLGVTTVVVLRALDARARPGSDDDQEVSPVSRADAAACQASVSLVERAVSLHRGEEGRLPASLDELVAAGWLQSAPATPGYELTLERAGGQPTGRVLVNGRAGAGACLVAATGGP